MRAVGVIPARVGAARFPGKALAPIACLPMIQRVWEGAQTAKTLRAVLIATDDARIADAALAFGAKVVETSSDHPTGSDRVAEVARKLEDEIVVEGWSSTPVDTPEDIAAVEARLLLLGRR